MSDRKTEESIDDFTWTNRISLGLLALGFTLLITFIVLIAAFHVSLPILGLVGVCMGFAGGITQHILVTLCSDPPVQTKGTTSYSPVSFYAMGLAHAGLPWPMDLRLMSQMPQTPDVDRFSSDERRP